MSTIHHVVRFAAFPGIWIKHNIVELLGFFKLESPRTHATHSIEKILKQYPQGIKEYVVQLSRYISLEEAGIKIITTFSLMNVFAIWLFNIAVLLLNNNSTLGWICMWLGISLIFHSFPSTLNILLFQTQFLLSKNICAKIVSIPFLLFFKAVATLEFMQSKLLFAIGIWGLVVLFL